MHLLYQVSKHPLSRKKSSGEFIYSRELEPVKFCVWIRNKKQLLLSVVHSANALTMKRISRFSAFCDKLRFIREREREKERREEEKGNYRGWICKHSSSEIFNSLLSNFEWWNVSYGTLLAFLIFLLLSLAVHSKIDTICWIRKQ